ncbi:hypothetical protein OROGR_024054 [Orobanche gracilis]
MRLSTTEPSPKKESTTLICRLQDHLSTVIVSDRFRAFKSNLNCSSHDLLGLPLLLSPTTKKLSTLLNGAEASLLRTCPNHLNLPSLTFAEMGATSSTFLKNLFGILSIIVRPNDQRNILISAAANLLSSDFFIAQHSEPYNIAGLIAAL